MRLYTAVLLGCCALVIKANEIANDVVSDYGQVKELLTEYYRRAARRFGHDYDPKSVAAQAAATTINDGTEASINRRIWTEVFENDIVLTLDQAQALLREQKVGRRGKRQAEPNAKKFWTNLTISYEFGTADAAWQTRIRAAIRHVESETCMRFTENGRDSNRLVYVRGSGCWSNVGMIGGRQQVSIGYGCDWLGIIAHETLHALGLWHEQSRNDRENYVSIRPNYIMRGTFGNFEKRTPYNSENLGQPYDLGSVMHYGPKAFTTDWNQITIATRDSNFQQTIGQRDGLSFKDAKMINTRYCTNVCSRKLPCQNEGYTDPNNCYQCRCPAGYGGRYCENAEYTSCGSELSAYDSYYRLASDFVTPTSNCVWRIRAPPGRRIELVFDEVSFLCRDTCRSYVEVKYKQSKTQVGARLCCQKPESVIVSEDNEVVLIFRGEPDLPNGYHGFTLRYRIYKRRPSGKTVAPPPLRTMGAQRRIVDTMSSPKDIFTTQPLVKRDSDGSEPAPTETPSTEYTTVTTTTEAPTTTAVVTTSEPRTRTPVTGEWGDWGAWTRCSHQCGGCGTRKRVRGCYGGNRKCLGDFLQTESCNIQECRYPKRGNICNGRIKLPCDMMERLAFGQKKENSPAEQDFLTRSKRDTSDLCEKRFTYYCPTGLLTIHIDWRTASDPEPILGDAPACCEGYYSSGGNCYKP